MRRLLYGAATQLENPVRLVTALGIASLLSFPGLARANGHSSSGGGGGSDPNDPDGDCIRWERIPAADAGLDGSTGSVDGGRVDGGDVDGGGVDGRHEAERQRPATPGRALRRASPRVVQLLDGS